MRSFELAGFLVEPVRAEKLGEAFHVPTRAAAAEERDHEHMRAFVQQQVASVVIGRLIVQPQFGAHRDAVDEVFVLRRHQAERLEAAAVADQVRAGLPAFLLGEIDAEVLRPLRHRRVEQRRQPVDLGAAGHIGVQNQVLAFELANAIRLGSLVVDRLRSLRRWLRLGRLRSGNAERCRQNESQERAHGGSLSRHYALAAVARSMTVSYG